MRRIQRRLKDVGIWSVLEENGPKVCERLAEGWGNGRGDFVMVSANSIRWCIALDLVTMLC
jgi:hypothetical protein